MELVVRLAQGPGTSFPLGKGEVFGAITIAGDSPGFASCGFPSLHELVLFRIDGTGRYAAPQLFARSPITMGDLTTVMRGYLIDGRCSRGEDLGPDAGAP